MNDRTIREEIWRRFDGDDWAAFDALPPRVRQRMGEHAYDPWAVNALIQFRAYRRRYASSARAEVTLLRYLEQCEQLEQAAFAERYRKEVGTPFPHVAARASPLRYRKPA